MAGSNNGGKTLSTLLSKEENDLVFTIIGDGNEIKAAAVVEALTFHSYADDADWSEFSTGVVCFVKDNNKKSYYIRLVDLGSQRSLQFEQEVYNHFVYKHYSPTLHSFAGDECLVEMSFADADEASLFSQNAEFKKRTRRNAIRKSSPASSTTAPATTDNDFAVKRKQKSKWKSAISKTVAITKSQHLAQVGIDPNTGEFDASKIAPNWKQLLDAVGVTQEQLKDNSTANFIYNFVEKRGGIEKANRQLEESRKRSVIGALSPRSQATSSRWTSCASAAKNKGNATHHPSSNEPALTPHPPPPPPLQTGGRVPPPPPPPPHCTPSSKDSTAKTQVAHPITSNAHSDLLSSIRAGIQLKSVEVREAPAAPEEVLDGLAGALARALASRSAVMQQSDDEDDPDDEWTD